MAQTSILIVDDSAEDAMLIRFALEKSDRDFVLNTVHATSAAMNYLLGHDPYSDRARFPIPELVLCDFRMTEEDGFALLSFVRQNREFCAVEVAVLSGLITKEIQSRAEKLGACACIDKGSLLSHREAFLRDVEECIARNSTRQQKNC